MDRSEAGYDAWRTDMQQLFGALGVAADTTVVTYDGAGEDIYATRPWWVLEYLGHDNVRVLNGGLAAWTEAGGETSGEPAAATPDSAAKFEGERRDAALATRDQVLELLSIPDVVILDARSPEEYAKAHIPGAVNVDYVLNRATTGPKLLATAGHIAGHVRRGRRDARQAGDRLLPDRRAGIGGVFRAAADWLRQRDPLFGGLGRVGTGSRDTQGGGERAVATVTAHGEPSGGGQSDATRRGRRRRPRSTRWMRASARSESPWRATGRR